MDAPTLDEVRAAARAIAPYISETPVHHWDGPQLRSAIAPGTRVALKLELFQHAGSFKARAAVFNLLSLSPEQRARGATAVSAGNHAIAVAYAASVLGVDAKVVMQSSANPARVARARALGAEVLIGGDGPACFALADRIVSEEGRSFIHPFEGKGTTTGAATLGLEMAAQMGPLDAVIVPIGGGGLASGVASAMKTLNPQLRIYGVEPEGADSMSRSLAAGSPQTIAKVSTIADSLGPPMALPYSFGLCRTFLDEIVLVDDDALCRAMLLLFDEMKLGVEPAAAASTAALLGPLRERLAGQRVGLIVCGSNIDGANHAAYLARGAVQ